MPQAVIVDVVRTPSGRGKPGGALSAPPGLPRPEGVRTTSTMTACGMATSCSEA